jgi:uncharacterized protein with PIN domain
MKDYSEHETIGTIADGAVHLECIKCGRKYWGTEDFEITVRAGQEPSLCGYCSGEHAPEGDDR